MSTCKAHKKGLHPLSRIATPFTPKGVAILGKGCSLRKEKVDTTLKGVSCEELDKHRDEIIYGMISKFATYKVVITDRYHGTIFSAIANTPVIVVNSADHKLSSGVKWFPEEEYHDAVQYAQSLDDAYFKAQAILSQKDRTYKNPPYFRNQYWDKLKDILEKK